MATTTPARRGRKAVENPDAPHGYEDDKKTPKAPHGFLENGKPRVHPKVDTSVEDLSLDFLSAPMDIPAEILAKTAPARARDEKQQGIDKVVGLMYDAYKAAGKPKAWDDPKTPKKMYPVPARAVAGIKRLIGRAGDYHAVAIRYGTPVRLEKTIANPDEAARKTTPTVKIEVVGIVFTVKDRRPKTTGGTGNAS
jgi:hypothetical protein